VRPRRTGRSAGLSRRSPPWDELTTLQEIYAGLAAEPELESTLRRTAEKIARAASADICAFLLYDPDTHELVTQPGAVGLPQSDEPLLYRVRVNDPKTSSGKVFISRKPLLIRDAQKDPRVDPRYARLWDFRALIVVPLLVDGDCIGVLRLGRRKAGVFAAAHLRLAGLVAHHAAAVIQNARLYARLQASLKELRNSNTAKTEVLSIVSHELLTPISSVKSFLAILLNEEVGGLTERQREFLDLCRRSLERLLVFVQDLLDISRLETGKIRLRLSEVQMGELLRDAAREQKFQAEAHGVRVEVEAPAGLPSVTADPDRVRQVVDNLLSNALKFTPSGGRVTLSARALADSLEISVKDTGLGISAAEQERIFERFYQVDAHRVRGAGLGLAICKSLVEHHGGKIQVESSPGQGSEFRFTLPRLPSVPQS
jgi:signal transduction histidine kinase